MIKYFINILIIFSILKVNFADHITVTSAPRVQGITITKISPEIVKELKDFVNLIPKATVDEIVAKHYIIDGNFREALKYLRSTQFTQLLEQAQQIPEVIEILDFLHLSQSGSGVVEQATCELPHLEKLTAFNVVEPLLDIVLLNDADVALHAYDVRTFSTFVEELMQHLPRDRYVQMINEKRQKSAAFAEFYNALRSVQFRPLVESALKSANLATIIKTLNSHDVDVKTLEPIGFTVLSWGPSV
ncbi:uncharacterized protein LOC119686281 [Teleopsis dalmanni]|uniref:uncharacterized protein LOC119686281 n=1 Tax=Teleopsis dalmanni TaxID=139649 RepID=UPI0018CF8358|nr:uncharacterized protein LOC119686281 [Teleopsis dalmanni]